MSLLYPNVGSEGAGNIILTAPSPVCPFMAQTFKLDGQRFFLTYPHADIIPNDLWTFVNTLQEVLWARICKETHESGEPHVHAVFSFKKRFQTRDPRIFDIDGKHPNIQGVRSVPKSLDYVSKDGNYVDFGQVPVKKQARAWADIVSASQGDENDWLQVCHEERVQPHVAKRLRELHKQGAEDLGDYDGRPLSACMAQLPFDFRSLLVVGPPGLGKTGWAMAHCPRPCLLVKHLDTLRLFKPTYHKSIFFDDCDFKHLPRATQLQLCDWENQCQIHVRYGVAMIPAHVPRLFACNPGNEPFIQDPAIQNRRLITIVLDPLYF